MLKTLLYAALMLAALGGMVAMNKKAKDSPAAKPVVFACFLVVLLGIFGLLKSTGFLAELGFDFGSKKRVIHADLAIYAAQADMILGVLEKAGLAKEKILLLCPSGYEQQKEPPQFIQRLKELGVEEQNIVCECPMGDKPVPGAVMKLTAQQLDKAANRHSACKVVISLLGTPLQPAGLSCIRQKKSASAQKWILLEPLNDQAAIRHGLQNGNILAACAFSPTPTGMVEAVPADPAECFALRYVLLEQ